MTPHDVPNINIQELENTILAAMERWQVPGLAIAIVKDGDTVLSKGYGTQEVGKNRPVDEHTLFAIVNTTTSFTAAALAILVGEGKMNWNDRLIDLLPDFKTGNDLITRHTTVIDALTGRTGLGSDTDMLSILPHPDLTRADILGQMKQLQSVSDFRSQLGFSSHTLIAAGEIIPALTGISWDDFVRDRLFSPIGMTDSVTGPHLFGDNRNIQFRGHNT